jgi:hypothetical protein
VKALVDFCDTYHDQQVTQGLSQQVEDSFCPECSVLFGLQYLDVVRAQNTIDVGRCVLMLARFVHFPAAST